MHSILGRGSFSTNSSISEVWHGSDQPVALLRHYWVFSSSGLSTVSHLSLENIPQIPYGVHVRHVGQSILSEKRTLDHWATIQFFFSLDQVRCFWCYFGITYNKGLGSPFPEDVWAWWLLMHWLQLQSTPCEALPSVWISFAWLYSQACGHPCCLCTFSYPISSFQSTLHLICFDTALCEQPHLSVMTFCDLPSLWRVSMFVFWIIAKSAVFPIIVVSKNKRYPEFIL